MKYAGIALLVAGAATVTRSLFASFGSAKLDSAFSVVDVANYLNISDVPNYAATLTGVALLGVGIFMVTR